MNWDLLCTRIIACGGLAVALACGSPTAHAATAHFQATAAVRGFEGSFAKGETRLELRRTATPNRFTGTLTINGIALPVEGSATGTDTFTGRYSRDARAIAITGTLRGSNLVLRHDGTTETLLRVDAASTTTADPKLGTRTMSPNGFLVPRANADQVPVSIPQPGVPARSLTPDGQLAPTPAAKPATRAASKTPTLVRPGMRLTFFLGSSTGRPGVVPVNPNDVTYSAGAGYMQVNVLDVTNGQATVETRQYVPNSTDNTMSAVTVAASVFPVETGGDGYWRSPAALEALPEKTKGDETVVRLNYPLDGKTYRAVRITTTTTTTTTQNTFDLDTGTLLSYGFNGTGANGTTQVIQMLFKGARQLRLPWIRQRPTAAVAGARQLRFTGQYSTVVDSAYSSTWSMTQDWKINKVDIASVQMQQTTTLLIGNTTPQRSTAAQTSALSMLWVDPKVLSGLRAGQVLDEDPITHARLSVLGTQNEMMVIGERNEIQSAAFGYDMRTGFIVAIQTELRNGIGTTTVFLQRSN